MQRRRFLSWGTSSVIGWLLGIGRGRAAAQLLSSDAWAVRRVRGGDEEQLLALMRSCVNDEDSFHGVCNPIEWTEIWAATVVDDRPRSIVLTLNETIVAYFDLPSVEPRLTGDPIIDDHRLAFWCGAAGVRLDLLGRDLSMQVFQRLLYEALSDAMSLGYEFVRAAAPWDRHPYLPQRFEAYPGMTVRPFFDEKGASKYLLEWRLADAVQTLAAASQPGA
jgi:hypothetical protein